MKKSPLEELESCIEIWHDKGHCELGKHNNCYQCGAPYKLLKLITGEEFMTKLTLDEWKKKLYEMKNDL